MSIRPNEIERFRGTALGVALLLAAALWAWVEPRPGQFEPRPRMTSPSWWWTPFENDSTKRPPSILGHFTGIAVVPGSNGRAVVAAGTDQIVWSADGGTHWRKARDNHNQEFRPFFRSVSFVAADSGWVVGDDLKIYHSSDGGKTWTAQNDSYGTDFVGVSFSTVEIGCLIGDAMGIGSGDGGFGFIQCTDDHGAHWHNRDLSAWLDSAPVNGTHPSLFSVKMLGQDSGWIAGEHTILHTTNGGSNWQSEFTDTDVHFFGVTAIDDQSVWAVGSDTQGGAAIFRHIQSGWTPAHISGSPESLKKRLLAVAFANKLVGWAVGDSGTIFQTSDGGANWNQQSSGTPVNWSTGEAEDFLSIACFDPKTAWVAGSGGTILHTDDGGANWTPQASERNFQFTILSYQRYPGPLFWLLILCAIPPLFRFALVEPQPLRSKIEEMVGSDSPVFDLKDDKLGHRALVERLTSFISNPNTMPPLVICLQARWGMGKSSVMRMLQSNLKDSRAALTVWFNAWHHQHEDELLAYLLQAIQEEAIPPWLTPLGLRFRIGLLSRRLFARPDRLALLVLATACFIFSLSGAIPAESVWQHVLSGGGVALFGWVVARALVAFQSNPEALVKESRGLLARTMKELLTLPSLAGKTGVRQIFTENLNDVVEALKPQRLVIFLDDLDRCRPEQVVQTLEAVNFLSSAAPCIVVLGADYKKVEALAAMQFEAIAVREEENLGVEDATSRQVSLSIAYTRNYLKKVVNLQLNLRLPEPPDFIRMLREPAALGAPRKRALRAAFIATLVGTVIGATWVADFMKHSSPDHMVSLRPAGAGADGGGLLSNLEASPPKLGSPPPGFDMRSPGTDMTTSEILAIGNNRWYWIFLPLALVLVVVFLYRRSRPKDREQAHDSQSFADALERRVEEICSKCDSPREVRRFLNYLRLIATGPDTEHAGDIGLLRKAYGECVDRYLVDLATTGNSPGASAESTAVEEYYNRQCDLFGLDPGTFAPRES